MAHRLRISLVIPVYNEESHIAACLKAALEQQDPFHEIIVVDNNSTDSTAAIARAFPSVTVHSEHRQGVVFARDSGFNDATGNIIARIDADTWLPHDWTQILAENFADEDVMAVTGAIQYYDVAAHEIIDKLDLGVRKWLTRRMPNHMFLLGANMAIRQSAWHTVRALTCHGGVHEDLDLAIHLADSAATVRFAPSLIAGVSARRADTNIIELVRYINSLPNTYAAHGAREQWYMYPVIGFILINYLPLRIAYRGFDEVTQSFSIAKLFGNQNIRRVNPVTFVD